MKSHDDVYVKYNGIKMTPYKRDALVAAHDFGYPQSVIDEIFATDDEDKISSIMTTARCRYL